jgi:hypothetical protein
VLIFLNNNLFAKIDTVDCIILEDENSIVCKYIQNRVNYERDVIFNWIEPNGKISRTRNLTIPARHGSVYDFRYKNGRVTGIWTLKVIDRDKEYKTTFEVK